MDLGDGVTFMSLDLVADCVDFPLRFSVFLCILRAELPRNETEADQWESGNTSYYAVEHNLFHVLLSTICVSFS